MIRRSSYIRVRVTPDQMEALRRAAARDGATVSEVVRRLVAVELRRHRPPVPPDPVPTT